MNIHRKRFFLLAAFTTMVVVAFAQQVGSNSPYGRYGFGVLSNPSIGSSESMGGISYGLRRSQHVNPGNPASYSKLDSLTFVFDIGLSGQYTKFSDHTNSQDFYNGNLDYIAMQFPLFKKMGASIGLLPYSKVGYNFGRTRYLSDIVYQESYRGSGGLSQIYGGISFEPLKNISIGANIAYLFGNFSYSNVATPLTSAGSRIGEKKSSFRIRDVKYDFGVQYTHPINRYSSFTVGAIYAPQIKATSTVYYTEQMFNSDPYSNPYQAPQEIIKSDTIKGQEFYLPHTFGLGATYMNTNFLVGIDATYQQWKNLKYPEILDGMKANDRFNNLYRINTGAEYVIDPVSSSFWRRIRFRSGLSFANSYTNVHVFDPKTNNSIGMGGFKEYGATLGFGLPFRDVYGKISMLNIGFGYTKQKPESSQMISQDMFKISIGMNINELWFRKFRFN